MRVRGERECTENYCFVKEIFLLHFTVIRWNCMQGILAYICVCEINTAGCFFVVVMLQFFCHLKYIQDNNVAVAVTTVAIFD